MCKKCKLAREREPRSYGVQMFEGEVDCRQDVEKGKEDEEWVEGDEEVWAGLVYEWEYVREGDGVWRMNLCERGLIRVDGPQRFDQSESMQAEAEAEYEAEVEGAEMEEVEEYEDEGEEREEEDEMFVEE